MYECKGVTTFLNPGAWLAPRGGPIFVSPPDQFSLSPDTKAYAARRMGEGRSKAEMMRCLKRFIAREVFRTLLGRAPVRTAATGSI